MKATTLTAGVLASATMFLVGCTDSGMIGGPSTSERTEMAAMAATAKIPTGNAATDKTVAAEISKNSIEIINYSGDQFLNSRVWVNGTYVAKADIKAKGKFSLPKSAFYNQTGQTLSKSEAVITKVQVQNGDTFFTLQGPIMDD